MGVCYSQRQQFDENNIETLGEVGKKQQEQEVDAQLQVQKQQLKHEVGIKHDTTIDFHDLQCQIQNSSKNILHSDASITQEIHFSSQQCVRISKLNEQKSILKKNSDNKSPKHVQFFFRKFDSHCTNFDIGHSNNRVPYEEEYHLSERDNTELAE